jgi:hypothetical protein
MRRSLDGMLFISWLGLGATIELFGYNFALYKFVHWTLPFIVAVGLFGVAAPLMQKLLGDRPVVFATLIFATAAAIEFSNATWLHWWTFSETIRQGFSNDWLLAIGVSAPLFPIAWIMCFGFRAAGQEEAILPDLLGSGEVIRRNRRAIIFSAICILLLIGLGRYGNAEYILRPLGFGYLASIAPLEPRTLSLPLGVGAAIVVFALQTVMILIALLLAVYLCGLSPASLGYGHGRVNLRRGLPLLLFLCVAPLPSFVLAGLDPAMSSNYPFVPSFASEPAFLAYESGYLLFFFTVESLFRGFLFLGFCSVIESTESSERGPQTAPVIFAGVLSCVAYIVWHLGKPVPELLGAVLWGPIACVIIWRTQNLLYLVVPHWVWNVVLDTFVTLKRLAVFGS